METQQIYIMSTTITSDKYRAKFPSQASVTFKPYKVKHIRDVRTLIVLVTNPKLTDLTQKWGFYEQVLAEVDLRTSGSIDIRLQCMLSVRSTRFNYEARISSGWWSVVWNLSSNAIGFTHAAIGILRYWHSPRHVSNTCFRNVIAVAERN